jgi:protein TonB
MSGSISLPRVPLRFIVVAAAHVGLFYMVTDALRFELAPEREPLEVLPMPEPDAEPVPEDEPLEPVPFTVLRGSAEFVPVRANPNHPLTRAPYPAASIRLEEEGVVELTIHVLANGRIADVKLLKSSGHPRLDRAAVEEARRHWRLQPATRGGEAIDAWGSFRVVFRLDRR